MEFLNQNVNTARNTQPLSSLRKRVLFIESKGSLAIDLAKKLQQKYHVRIEIAEDPFEAMNLMSEGYYDLIILDSDLRSMSGAEVMSLAEKELFFDPALSIQWDVQKVPVVTLSMTNKSRASHRTTRHFNYVGTISKQQSNDKIVAELGNYVNVESQLKIS